MTAIPSRMTGRGMKVLRVTKMAALLTNSTLTTTRTETMSRDTLHGRSLVNVATHRIPMMTCMAGMGLLQGPMIVLMAVLQDPMTVPQMRTMSTGDPEVATGESSDWEPCQDPVIMVYQLYNSVMEFQTCFWPYGSSLIFAFSYCNELNEVFFFPVSHVFHGVSYAIVLPGIVAIALAWVATITWTKNHSTRICDKGLIGVAGKWTGEGGDFLTAEMTATGNVPCCQFPWLNAPTASSTWRENAWR